MVIISQRLIRLWRKINQHKLIMKKFLLVFGWIILTIVLTVPFGRLYQILIPQNGSLFVVSQEFVDLLTGIGLSWIFSLTLLFTTFGGAKKYWWIGFLLIPAVAFELYFDLAHIYFPVALALLGWGIGYGVSKISPRQKAP